MPAEVSLKFDIKQNRLTLSGELDKQGVLSFEQRVAAQPFTATTASLALHDFDILDGVAATAAVNMVRAVIAKSGGVVLHGAPQLLAHNLYRVGLLEGGSPITLIDMREDEAYG